uniref:Uncharacterized protein n=1 Tax=Molossus molossus TaxID=27622 RepID=A0A7J8FZ28_MOLMO|nr:hypothetical protein HJG59_008213 [Molossus molossus]
MCCSVDRAWPCTLNGRALDSWPKACTWVVGFISSPAQPVNMNTSISVSLSLLPSLPSFLPSIFSKNQWKNYTQMRIKKKERKVSNRLNILVFNSEISKYKGKSSSLFQSVTFSRTNKNLLDHKLSFYTYF